MTIMEKTDCSKPMPGQNNKMTPADTRPGCAMRIPTVTQNMPDDTFDEGGPMVATHGDEPPTRRELEQDVTMTNPSVESMEGRG